MDAQNTSKLISLFKVGTYVSLLFVGFYIAWSIFLINYNSTYWTNILQGLQTIATIFLLYTLKRYLNELNDHKKSDYIIFSYVSISVLSATLIFFPKNITGTYGLIFIFVSGLLSLLLMINLIKIKNDYSGHIKSFGYFKFFCWLGAFVFFLLAMGGMADVELSLEVRIEYYKVGLIASAITGIIPFIVLARVFIKTGKRLKQQD